MKLTNSVLKTTLLLPLVVMSCKKQVPESINPEQTVSPSAVSEGEETDADRWGPTDFLYGVTSNTFYKVRISDGAHMAPLPVMVYPNTIGGLTGIAKDYSVNNKFYITNFNDGSAWQNRFLSFTYPPSPGITFIDANPGAMWPAGQGVEDIEFQPTTNIMYGISNSGYLIKITGYSGGTAVFTNIGAQLVTIGADFGSCKSMSFDDTGICYLISNTGRVAAITIAGLSYSVNNITGSHFSVPAGYTLNRLGSGILRFHEDLGFMSFYIHPTLPAITEFRFSNKDASGIYSTSSLKTGVIVEPCNDYTHGICGSCPK
jgi:hypothetical protein